MSAQLEREQGRFELSRGRVTCDMARTSRHHARVCTSILTELGRLLDRDVFDIGGGLGVALAMAAIFRGIPDARRSNRAVG